MRVQDGEGALDQGEHLRTCVFETACIFKKTDRLSDFLLILCAFLQDVEQFLRVFGILKMMDGHQRDFSLMDVLTIVTLGLLEFLSLKIQEIILDLKGNS